MARKTKKQDKYTGEEDQLAFGQLNYVGFAIALVVIAIGFFTLSQGSMVLAPVLLVLGYCVIVPLAIMFKSKPEKNAGE